MPRALRGLIGFGLIGNRLTILCCASAIDDALPSLRDRKGRNALILGKGSVRGELERADARSWGLYDRISSGGSGTSGGCSVDHRPEGTCGHPGPGLCARAGRPRGRSCAGVALIGPSAVRGWLMRNVVAYLKVFLLVVACWKSARGEFIGLWSIAAWALFTLAVESLPLLWLTGGGDVDAWMSCLYPAAVLFLS